MDKLKIAVIISSTRDARYGPIAAEWMHAQAGTRDELDVQIVDLKEFDLPLFNELGSNIRCPSQDPKAVAWQKKIGEFDGYIIVTAEYNRSLTGAMKNAFDQAYVEWMNKPIGFFGYGAVGASRAIEHGRTIAIELHMVPVRSGVHIGGSEYIRAVHQREPIANIEPAIMPSTNEMLDQLIWWGNATKVARGNK